MQQDRLSIYLWQPDLSGCHFQQSNQYKNNLSESEKIIFDNISSRRRKEEYIAGHYFIRQLLPNFNPHKPEVFHQKDQAPIAVNHQQQATTPFFNLSHSQNTIACCISNTIQAGIDIEYQKPRKNLLAIVNNYFTKYEFQQLSSLEHHAQEIAFYRLWTLKESYLKAQRNNQHEKILTTQFSRTKTNNQNNWQSFYSQISETMHIAISTKHSTNFHLDYYLWDENQSSSKQITWQSFYPIT